MEKLKTYKIEISIRKKDNKVIFIDDFEKAKKYFNFWKKKKKGWGAIYKVFGIKDEEKKIIDFYKFEI